MAVNFSEPNSLLATPDCFAYTPITAPYELLQCQVVSTSQKPATPQLPFPDTRYVYASKYNPGTWVYVYASSG